MIMTAIRKLVVPLGIVLISLLAAQFGAAASLARWVPVPERNLMLAFAMIGWAAGAVVACRLIQLLVWDLLTRRNGRAVPRLLIQLTNILIFVTAAFGVSTLLFNIPVTGAIATSSVIGLVVGFALKSLIADMFSGIALNLDRGFGIDDYVQVLSRAAAAAPGGRITGRITEINWRSTYILTGEESLIVIPNSLLSESIVLNFSKPDIPSEFEMIVALDYEIDSARAVRVLLAAVQAAGRENPAVFDGRARITEATANGINYKIKYMLDASKLGPGKARNLILGHLLRHLSSTGLKLAHPKVENWNIEQGDSKRGATGLARIAPLLQQVHLFRDLERAAIADLAERVTERSFPAGTAVMTAGEPGQSMFVLSEGLVSVRIAAEKGEIDVAALSPGDFFGEMSLLTGEPRSASIVAVTDTIAFEIDKAAIQPLLESTPAAAEILSLAAAERRLSSDAARAAKPPEQIAAERSSLAGKILAGMNRFLGRREPPETTRKKR